MSKKLECIIRSHDEIQEMEDKARDMIDTWLSNNKPSIEIKHNEKMPHVIGQSSLGANTSY